MEAKKDGKNGINIERESKNRKSLNCLMRVGGRE